VYDDIINKQVTDRGVYDCSLLWSTPTVIQRRAVDGERKGVRGGKCGKPTSNSLSFSITHCRLDKTSGGCYIPTHCPRQPAGNVTPTLLHTVHTCPVAQTPAVDGVAPIALLLLQCHYV